MAAVSASASSAHTDDTANVAKASASMRSRTPWPSLGGHRRQDQEQRKAEAQRPLLRQGAHRVHACEDEHDRPHPQRQRGQEPRGTANAQQAVARDE